MKSAVSEVALPYQTSFHLWLKNRKATGVNIGRYTGHTDERQALDHGSLQLLILKNK